jgi:hypothetical protein
MVSTKRRHRPQRGAHALPRASTIDDVEISDANTSVCSRRHDYVIAMLHVMVSSQDHVGIVFWQLPPSETSPGDHQDAVSSTAM